MINKDKLDNNDSSTSTGGDGWDFKQFDAIVSNPPYSIKWIGSDDPTLINDYHFAPARVLTPKRMLTT